MVSPNLSATGRPLHPPHVHEHGEAGGEVRDEKEANRERVAFDLSPIAELDGCDGWADLGGGRLVPRGRVAASVAAT